MGQPRNPADARPGGAAGTRPYHRRTAGVVAAVCLGAWLAPATARAEGTLGDRVERHLDDGLEKKRKKKRKPRPRSNGAGPVPAGSTGPAPSAAEPAAEPPAPSEPDPNAGYPKRIFGRELRIDPRAGIGYRHWIAQSYPSVSTDVQGYPVWSVGVRAQIFRVIVLERLALESSGLSVPGRPGVSVAVQASRAVPQAAWLLGAVGFPINFVVTPLIRYEQRAFQTTATPRRPVVVVPHGTSPDVDPATLPATTEPLQMVSAFETIVVAARYDHDKVMGDLIGSKSKPSSIPPMYLGLGYTNYSKPYVLNVDGFTLDEFVWDTRFQGLGLAYGLSTVQRSGRPWLDLSSQVGLGQIDLLSHYTLNDALPGNWMVGYVQGDVTVGYLHPLLRTTPTLMGSISASAGGAGFFAFQTKVEEGETVHAPPLNWDLLWSVQAQLTLPL